MKMFVPIALGFVLFVLGVLLGVQLNRYEYANISQYPARFDKWTGKLQIISFSVSDEFSQRLPLQEKWPGTPVPTSTPR